MIAGQRVERSRAVAAWLFATAFLVFAMVIVGGATRLTGSGLSITQWKPVTGAIPPLSQAAWLAEFHRYQQIPQYQLINHGMSLDAFKSIYWWEWSHRLLGRLLGVVFALPLVIFAAMRRLPQRLIWRVVVLFVLGGLQGFVGWWMVKSGLEARVTVAPERLATHLGLALLLYAALIWTGLEAWAGPRRRGEGRDTPLGIVAAAMAVMAYFQCLLGALVAGNQAGLVDNDWPMMNGRLFPDDYWLGGLARTLLHSRAAVQFNHRILAYVLFATALVTALAALRIQRLPTAVKTLAMLIALLITAQACLGIITLMRLAPVPLSLAHQAGAAVVLGVSIAFAWRARRAGGF